MKYGSFDTDESGVFIIAELSANHNRDLEVAVNTIKAMKDTGADAVKIQTYTPDSITIDCDNEFFQINNGSLWDGTTLYSLYETAYTPYEWQAKLQQITLDMGLEFLSSPFDNHAVDFLEDLNVPVFKIASFEIQDIPLIAYAASKGKPIIISTGIAEEKDIKLAVDTCRAVGNNDITLLKCTSAYPATIDQANLATMVDMKSKFNVAVGLSDHTIGMTVPMTAAALGAEVIEKHFILDRALGGPDAAFSLNPQEFTEMVNAVRQVESAKGDVTYELSEKVKANRQFSRSLFAVKEIKAGEIFTNDNVRSIRPGYGLHPKYLSQIEGTKALVDIAFGSPLSMDHIKTELD